MFYYRLYFMSASSGHILRFAEYEAPNDEAAIALATEHEGANPLELWCQHRKVKRFERDSIPFVPFARVDEWPA